MWRPVTNCKSLKAVAKAAAFSLCENKICFVLGIDTYSKRDYTKSTYQGTLLTIRLLFPHMNNSI